MAFRTDVSRCFTAVPKSEAVRTLLLFRDLDDLVSLALRTNNLPVDLQRLNERNEGLVELQVDPLHNVCSLYVTLIESPRGGLALLGELLVQAEKLLVLFKDLFVGFLPELLVTFRRPFLKHLPQVSKRAEFHVSVASVLVVGSHPGLVIDLPLGRVAQSLVSPVQNISHTFTYSFIS